ncbi:MAG: T9SS type A sorting domain-containing protein, partial [ANME-2 cluster archaeon]
VENGFVISGTFYKDDTTRGYVVIKTDIEGDTLWCKFYENPKKIRNGRYLVPNWIEKTSDGGFIISANQNCSSLGSEFSCYYSYLIKTNSIGDTLWTKGFVDYFGHKYYRMLRVLQTVDDGYIFLGSTNGWCDEDICQHVIVKTNPIGIPSWQKSVVGYCDRLVALEQTNDGELILIDSYFYILGVDQYCDILWTIKNSSYMGLRDIIKTKKNYFVTVGDKISKLSKFGEYIWQDDIPNGQGYSVHETSDGGYLVGGISDHPTNKGVCVWRFDTDITNVEEDLTSIPSYLALSQNYPNPFNPSTTIEFSLPKSEFVELKVYNILGKEVETLVSNKLNQGNHTYTFDGKNLASGVYYYQLVAGDYREVKKMILLK